jgi:hypothetical protein
MTGCYVELELVPQKLSLGFQVLYVAHSPPYGLAIGLRDGPVQCADNTACSKCTVHGSARRPHFLHHYLRNHSTSNIDIFGCSDVILPKD